MATANNDYDWEAVMTEYEVIRSEGHCNMFDKACVKNVAEQLGFDNLLEVIENGDYTECFDKYEEYHG